MIGAKLGSYDVVSKLGEGGMGEVYRARDARLNRDVAIKVLPGAVALDPERVVRFEREAQTLASLNHPNIAQVHGVIDEPLALVMECVEGEDLSRRIARGPLPIDEALAIARQIAAALAAAHERGIIHRDLKPANIMIAADGTVKILDFGLAKAMTRDEPGAADPANSPTFSNLPQMTQMGVILGTAAYMSPEQARGKRVDQRTDLWAFGCVVYEMLSGQTPFQGEDESVAAVLAKILEREPDYEVLPARTPASMRRLIRRCLAKNPARRLASAQDAALEIDDVQAEPEYSGTTALQRRVPIRLAWFVAAAFGLGLAGTSVALWRTTRPSPAQAMRYDLRLPGKTSLALAEYPPVAISHDGSTVVLVGTAEGGTQLFVRRRDEATIRPLEGTDNGADPVFSPDDRWLLFRAGRDLKKMVIGSAPVTIGGVETSRGATWLDDRSIVFAPDAAMGLMRIPRDGGPLQPLTTLDAQKGERSHRWPAALPGGKAVLFIVGTNASPDDYNNSDVDAVIVATGERRHVMTGASFVRYVPTGHLIFMRNGTINAVRFNPDSLTVSGVPAPVVNGVAGDVTTGAAAFACADDGTLVYAPGSAGTTGNSRRLEWVDRSGAVEPLPLPPALYNDVRIAPDGRRLAVVVGTAGSGDVWIFDIERKTFTRLAFDRNAGTPVWSPDSQSVFYASIEAEKDRTTFYRRPVDGSRDREQVGAIEGRAFLLSVDASGKLLQVVKTSKTQGRVSDIVLLNAADGTETPLVATGADEYSGSTSPDGRWLAYQSNESGRFEIYVRNLSEGGGRWQVSATGGEEPRWSADGRELFFRIDNRFMHADVVSQHPFGANTPTKLFEGMENLRSDTGNSYDVDPRTGRFVMTRSADPAAAPSVTSLNVVLNWFDDLRRTSR
jgi:Tol biopolymer transport system component